MAPPRSRTTSAKRGARPRAPPNPSPAPPAAPAADPSNPRHQLLRAAHDGDLRRLKRLVGELDKGRGRPREVVEAAEKEAGFGALFFAAGYGGLPVCRYLVEELGVDVDAAHHHEDTTPLACAILGGNSDTVRYLLDHGADPARADNTGFTPLHHAARRGYREMVELLLAKGVSVDPASGSGTPLHRAASFGHDEVMKILLDNNADYNKMIPGVGTPLLAAIAGSSVKCVKLLVQAGADVNGGLVAPLAAAVLRGETACMKCLLEAGADPNAPLSSGTMPIEIAAVKGTREDVEILFPVTSCIPTVHDWTIDGIIRHAKSEFMKQGEYRNVSTIADFRSLAAKSMKRNDYYTAAMLYTGAMEYDRHDATLFSNRSLCYLRMGDGRSALQDALACREIRPNWPKGCYRHGAVLMLLKDYGRACNAFLDAAKLDPLSPKIEAALREALNSLTISHVARRRLSE